MMQQSHESDLKLLRDLDQQFVESVGGETLAQTQGSHASFEVETLIGGMRKPMVIVEEP